MLRFFMVIISILYSTHGIAQSELIVAGGKPSNDIVKLLEINNIPHHYFENTEKAIHKAKKGQGVFIITNPEEHSKPFTKSLIKKIKAKNLRLYIESSDGIPGMTTKGTLEIHKERAIVLSPDIPGLKPMDILGINNERLQLFEETIDNPLLVFGKVAGSERAEYGLNDTEIHPLLFFKDDNYLISAARLSNVISGRFGPNENWKHLFNYIINWLSNKNINLNYWPSSVHPSYPKDHKLPEGALIQSIFKGTEWFYNTKLLVHPSWEHQYTENTDKSGKDVVHPPVSSAYPIGDGSNGILEGHASRIGPDGSQPYRWWIRADCQAETAFALSSASLLQENDQYTTTAKNLLTYLFEKSNLRSGERDDPNSPSFGLIGWATTDPDAYYGDDNARALLAVLGASTNLNINEWDDKLIEGILGNFRTTGINGFRGPWFRDAGMQKTTWQDLGEREIVNIHPHYESWLWALYLWLYDKTDYAPFLEKSKAAISITMDAYPNWKWTNGIQQEYVRMILPLAWLVRVEDTPKHREWLRLVVEKLTNDMSEYGAIPEKFGKPGLGRYEKIQSNAEYGTKEAPLISSETDEVSDMLYTMNFALFSLNEAANATGTAEYALLSKNISEFLIKIQAQSEDQKDLDGAWFRAFDYGKWEYWASNADSDWGPWGTLTGWTQSWIINGLINQHTNKNLWDSSKTHYDNKEFKNLATSKIESMLITK